MKKSLETCKNCENKFEQGFNFCPYCGQKSNDELTVSVLFQNTISNYFSVDARFFKSFIPLMFKPGYLANRFVEGRRLLYLHPAQMYLFISVVFFFLFSFISRDQVKTVNNVLKKAEIPVVDHDSLKTQKIDSLKNVTTADYIIKDDFSFNERAVDSLIAIDAPKEAIYKVMGMDSDAGFFKRRFYTQILKFYEQRNGGSILQAFYDSIPIAMFFLLPIFALILKLLYYKRTPFSFHLVFSLYFFAFVFMTFSFLVLVDLIWKPQSWLNSLVTILVFIYFYIAVLQFYKQSKLKSLFKSIITVFSFLIMVIPAASAVMFIVAFLFY
ncbi:DUF3667 domain-containing protein [Aestuariibaculum suncheonense]|uniref:DUF3667 domain-containing protein n=1 Tax=Aestuariibaculum suncheonense TaxID=1028745 RepID=A0A8J6QHV8_9FLAO|nr:DUF3667 domain-containing protein [Aestuariibaculum suncheonense]MBD0835491.1 DUF3667 domain-containing protein [Aestuariibaculum suncheonense]